MMSLLAKSALSQLVVIDMQVRLADVMPTDAMQAVVKNCGVLLQVAKLLEVPVIITEQYPKGLGVTLPELSALSDGKKPIEKIAFSCVSEPRFKAKLTSDKSQLILAGMEAHICILQTALGLLQVDGKQSNKPTRQVFVVEDAIISRNPNNKANAISRMRDAGCIIINTESIVFEWLGVAQGDVFKQISQLIR